MFFQWLWTLLDCSGGSREGAWAPPLTLGKKRKESQRAEKLAGQATKKPGFPPPPKVWIHHWIIRWYERKFRCHITYMIKIAFEKFLFKLNNVWTLETEVTKKSLFVIKDLQMKIIFVSDIGSLETFVVYVFLNYSLLYNDSD